MTATGKGSKAWSHFTRLNENAAEESKKCKTVVASKGRKTNSIAKHLKIKHRLNLKQRVVFERFSCVQKR